MSSDRLGSSINSLNSGWYGKEYHSYSDPGVSIRDKRKSGKQKKKINSIPLLLL